MLLTFVLPKKGLSQISVELLESSEDLSLVGILGQKHVETVQAVHAHLGFGG